MAAISRLFLYLYSKKTCFMKRIFLLTALLSSTLCFAQQKADSVYKRIFGEFVKYYNANEPDRMSKLFEGGIRWTKESIKKDHEERGKITAFKYIGPFKNELDGRGNVMVYFKVIFDKKANIKGTDYENRSNSYGLFNGKNIHAGAIALDNKNLIVGYRLYTSSRSLDSLMAKY